MAKLRYHGAEFTFNKRMSHGWQLGGSVTLSKSEGNTTGASQRGSDFRNPNSLVNSFGLTANDRPIFVKLFGSFSLPWKLMASFSYRFASGAPFTRTVTVYPPAAWAAANNVNRSYTYTINVEPRGSRRDLSQSQLDFRIEKQFSFSKIGTFGVFLDVFNILGFTHVNVNQNPAGSWRPTGANTNVGTLTPTGSYARIASVDGNRILKFSVRFRF